MSVAMSILAMVAEGPRYGYELRAEFDRRTGARWPLNVGQVYKSLDRLERDELVTKSPKTDAEGHVFYEATTAGLESAKAWLSSSGAVPTRARDDLAIKLAIAVTLPDVDIEALLREQRSAAMQHLQKLTRESVRDAVQSAQDLAARIVSDAVIIEAETQLRWLDQVTERIRDAHARGISLVVPFDTERPRRGRPRSAATAAAAARAPAQRSAPTARHQTKEPR